MLSDKQGPHGARYEVWPGLRLQRWAEPQAVVFHPASNSTHLVDACAASILSALIEQPGEEPLRHVKATADAGANAADAVDAAAQQVADTLGALLQAGMVRQIPD